MQVKVVNGRVELRRNNGILVGVVGYSNAMHAELHPTKNILLIISETGKLELRCFEGRLIKEILPSGVKDAKFKNDIIEIQSVKGHTLEHPLK
jgi:hypothetical protein